MEWPSGAPVSKRSASRSQRKPHLGQASMLGMDDRTRTVLDELGQAIIAFANPCTAPFARLAVPLGERHLPELLDHLLRERAESIGRFGLGAREHHLFEPPPSLSTLDGLARGEDDPHVGIGDQAFVEGSCRGRESTGQKGSIAHLRLDDAVAHAHRAMRHLTRVDGVERLIIRDPRRRPACDLRLEVEAGQARCVTLPPSRVASTGIRLRVPADAVLGSAPHRTRSARSPGRTAPRTLDASA